MSNSIYGFIALTGGAAGALDKIDGAGLADQDIAIGCAGGIFYAYILDDDSAAAESSPNVIAPDDNAGDKRWILQSTLPAAFNVLLYKGTTDCSGNPNYPAADAGHCYIVSGAGKIGGASGADVEIGDLFICNTDSTASGDQATVGTKWNIIQTNLDPTDYVTHALATAANDFLVASGAGVFVKKTLAETLTILGKAAASGIASLDAGSKVVQDPANATATPTASKIPIADAAGKLDNWTSRGWKDVAAASYTTAPASTSTITMGVDLTASIIPGMSLRYTIGGTEYFGMVYAIAANLLTIKGAPLGGNVSNLKYGGGILNELVLPVNGLYEDASDTALLTNDDKIPLIWRKEKSYAIAYQAWSRIHDTGTDGQVSVRINNTELNTTAGGLTIAADATWYYTIVDIATAAYDINYGEAIEVTSVKNGTGDAEDLCVILLILTP